MIGSPVGTAIEVIPVTVEEIMIVGAEIGIMTMLENARGREIVLVAMTLGVARGLDLDQENVQEIMIVTGLYIYAVLNSHVYFCGRLIRVV